VILEKAVLGCAVSSVLIEFWRFSFDLTGSQEGKGPGSAKKRVSSLTDRGSVNRSAWKTLNVQGLGQPRQLSPCHHLRLINDDTAAVPGLTHF